MTRTMFLICTRILVMDLKVVVFSNGITKRKDRDDGTGIDYRISNDGNEWRWTEQWLPHGRLVLTGGNGPLRTVN